MKFYLGTHETSWLARLRVPLFVSHRRLRQRRRLPRAAGEWALDSGGFTELSMHGAWRTSESEYIEAVCRYEQEIGNLAWAAPMDWMCEPHIVQNTGLSVREHQERTVANYLTLGEQGPFIPVLQGWRLEDYEHCVALYHSAGVALETLPLVGVGSVCRRQRTGEIAMIMRTLAAGGLRLHGFGVKKRGLARYGAALASADSMAWSYAARREDPLEGCTHRSCSNCSRYALRWREDLLALENSPQLELPVPPGRRFGARPERAELPVELPPSREERSARKDKDQLELPILATTRQAVERPNPPAHITKAGPRPTAPARHAA